jgi:hypothetical protein
MTTTQNTDTMQAKIEKLLAKAERTDNPHEAEAFSRKAEALMVQWGIDEAMLAATRTTAQAEEIVEEKIVFTGRYAKPLAIFGSYIATGLGNVRLLQGPTYSPDAKQAHALYLIGFRSDVTRAQMLITSLHLQMTTAQRAWWKADMAGLGLTQAEGVRARRQFMFAFATTVELRLRELNRAAEADTQAHTTTSVSLVLASRSDMVNDYVGEKYPNLRTTRSSMKGSRYGSAAGREAGRSANLGSGSNNVRGGNARALR